MIRVDKKSGRDDRLFEPRVGLEPTNLFVTNEMLYQLSYRG